jgi:D-alanyl-D-alanine dipeptidase
MDALSIGPNDLMRLDDADNIRIDLVYGNARHPENIFGTALYRPGAALWLHILFAPIVLEAARLLAERHNTGLILKDGLRTMEAQVAMQETAIVKANPQWCEGPSRLLSLPGQGGHPRGMAVDVAPYDLTSGAPWDMGTVFDTMHPSSARAYTGFHESVLIRRARLEKAFVDAAASSDLPMLPLPSEWWDFRFPASFSERYAPVSDNILPPHMRMADRPLDVIL